MLAIKKELVTKFHVDSALSMIQLMGFVRGLVHGGEVAKGANENHCLLRMNCNRMLFQSD